MRQGHDLWLYDEFTLRNPSADGPGYQVAPTTNTGKGREFQPGRPPQGRGNMDHARRGQPAAPGVCPASGLTWPQPLPDCVSTKNFVNASPAQHRPQEPAGEGLWGDKRASSLQQAPDLTQTGALRLGTHRAEGVFFPLTGYRLGPWTDSA